MDTQNDGLEKVAPLKNDRRVICSGLGLENFYLAVFWTAKFEA